MKEKIRNSMGLGGVVLALVAFYAFSFVFKAQADNISTSVTVQSTAPTVSNVELASAASSISLTENTSVVVHCSGTISDQNGGADILLATATIYRSGVTGGVSCSASNNDCYQIASSSCSLGSASGNDKSVDCTANIWFHADPTDPGSTYAAQTWGCQITGMDMASSTGSASDSTPPDMNSLSALDVTASIAYGTLSASYTPSNVTVTTTVTTTGNVSIDTNLAGTNMTSGGNTITVDNQKYATSTKTWASSVSLATSSAVLVLNVGKPTTNPSNMVTSVFWGIAIPSGTPAGTYTGSVTSSAVAH